MGGVGGSERVVVGVGGITIIKIISGVTYFLVDVNSYHSRSFLIDKQIHTYTNTTFIMLINSHFIFLQIIKYSVLFFENFLGR